MGRTVIKSGERTLEIYADLPPLRAFAAAIPIVGSSLDAVLGGYGSRLATDRVMKLLRELQEFIHKLDATKIEKAFFASEEGADLVMHAITAGARTGDEEKTRLYAAILAGSAVEGETREPEPESLLDALAALSPSQVEMLAMLRRAASNTGYLSFLVAARARWGGNLEFHLSRIAASGFITGQGSFSDVVGGSNYAGTHYVTTPTFDRLLEIVGRVYPQAFES